MESFTDFAKESLMIEGGQTIAWAAIMVWILLAIFHQEAWPHQLLSNNE